MADSPIYHYCPYSWHQSHDQATVLLMLPYDTTRDDVVVVFERNSILVCLNDQLPLIKGRLHGNISVTSSTWQLEPRSDHSPRERTTSTASTVSTQSSYAFVSDPDISSSFAASLDSGQVSDAEERSPIIASPRSIPSDGFASPTRISRRLVQQTSRSVSPGNGLRSLSSFSSSLESLHHSPSGRLLTLYLEKEASSAYIWPSLITGPAPETMSDYSYDSDILHASKEREHKYSIDPHSMVLMGQDLYDIRKDKEGAFEYFIRAWHQVKPPVTTLKLATSYVPLQVTSNPSHFDFDDDASSRETIAYYIHCIGGRQGLARIYLEAGMLHLEGAATSLLSSSSSGLASIRMPSDMHMGESDTEAWKRDREAAAKYFDRARILHPDLDIPSLPNTRGLPELEMPSLDMNRVVAGLSDSQELCEKTPSSNRRTKKEMIIYEDRKEMDPSWYLYIPGLVGAGTALLMVAALSFSSWRRNQS